MKKVRLIFGLSMAAMMIPALGWAQEEKEKDLGEIHGFLQIDGQTYTADSASGITQVPDEKAALMAFGNLTYRKGNFEAGVRYEAFLPPLLGLDQRYRGQGIANRYAKYRGEQFEITIGHFYEQFGSGMILRAYWEWTLGLDNAIDGFRFKYSPIKGLNLTGLYGKQRYFWENGEGTVRGFDANANLNQLLKPLRESTTFINIGASFVSKFQPDNSPVLVIPENVAGFSARVDVQRGRMRFSGKYARKANDPSAVNGLIYRKGEALLLNLGYVQSGLGINLSAKRLDNMSFKSDRNEGFFNLDMNYLPALTRVHTYRLPTLYPYATQPNGEMAIQGDVIYRIKRGTPLGGKYGTTVSINYSRSNSIRRDSLDNAQAREYKGYDSPFLAVDQRTYWQDFNIEITRKFTKKIKATLSYLYLQIDSRQINVVPDFFGNIYTHIGIIDLSYKLKPKHLLRVELQHMYTEQDRGDWAMALIEYTLAPKFTFAYMHEWNYGNPDENLRIHFPSATFIYQEGNTRISMGYGKQRAGVICVGGVCRNVPASNGASLSITTNF